MKCPGCGLDLLDVTAESHPYLGASTACWTLFGEVLAREYGDPEYFTAHQVTVDAYAAQHPGMPEPRTIQSINVHLVGLYLSNVRNLQADFVRQAKALLTQRHKNLNWLEPPVSFGRLRVDDVLKATTAKEHGSRVKDWGDNVWLAWKVHHAEIIDLADRTTQALD